MNPIFHKSHSVAIVYDADSLPLPDPGWFDPVHWREQGRLGSSAPGRGQTWMVDPDAGPAVLRAYLRGGWPRHLSRDRYVFTGYQRSRPMHEFRILTALNDAGLPAPAPLAAICSRKGLLCTGSLLMRRIEHVATLADRLEKKFVDQSLWRATGACIRRFHEEGVTHADLNARNILLAADGQVFLIDFDRARYQSGRSVDGSANLDRLKRSMIKLWPGETRPEMDQAWERLMDGYRG